MSYCINCGTKLPDEAKFCLECGFPVNGKSEITKRKEIFEGTVHKCPNCGEIIDAFVVNCPSCGYEVRERKKTSCVHELSLKLENIKDKDEKKELIKNFYIPNTKEDIYEFFILASSNIEANSYDIDAWDTKLEQAYQKAKIIYNSSEEISILTELYETIIRKRKMNRIVKSILKSRILKCIIVFILGLFVCISGIVLGSFNEVFYFITVLGLGFIVIGCIISLSFD